MTFSVLSMALLVASCTPTSNNSGTVSSGTASSGTGPSQTTEAAATTEATETTAVAAETFKQPVVYAEAGIALKGADPVAYFTDGTYVQGEAAYSHDWNGATWHFASAENRDQFASDPDQFAPQYGGYCAWAVSQGKTAAIDPNAWDIVDGKLYLNYNQNVKDRWVEDIPGNIDKANQNWPQVLNN
ncbi:MAG: YHS domain-containing (seleno)protein [Cyanobacteria bacterium]|nr:YHS domain-containing (seleno)protein [Cyanobacteriota bacterium]